MGIGGKKTFMEILASRSHTTCVFVRPGHIDQLRKLVQTLICHFLLTRMQLLFSFDQGMTQRVEKTLIQTLICQRCYLGTYTRIVSSGMRM